MMDDFTEVCHSCHRVYRFNPFVFEVLLQSTCPYCGARNPENVYRSNANIAILANERGTSLRLELGPGPDIDLELQQ